MKCPFCKADDTRVIDSRVQKDGFGIRRRRDCLTCGRRFNTCEQIFETPVQVIKKDQTRVPFDRQKIVRGVTTACYKRPINDETINAIAAKVEAEVLSRGEMEIPSSQIGEMVMQELRETDQIAYVRFASVYREFKDINELNHAIQQIRLNADAS